MFECMCVCVCGLEETLDISLNIEPIVLASLPYIVRGLDNTFQCTLLLNNSD